MADLAGFDGKALAAALSPQGWALRPVTSRDLATSLVEFDERWRVEIPIGVRHRLGLVGSVVVSVSVDATRVVLWPASLLDELLAVGP